MSVTPSTVVGAEVQASEGDLWALSFLLSAEWSEGLLMRSAYMTDIATARTGGEQRRGLLGKPLRMLEANLQSMSQKQVLGLQSSLARMGSARTLGPLYCDQSHLTSATASGGTVLNCDTQYRRLSVGARVVVFNPSDESFSVRTILSMTTASITLTTTLGTDMPVGSKVFPLMECRLTLESTGEIKGEFYARVKVIFAELPGVWSLDTTQGIGSTPAGVSEYAGFPILNIPIDYSQSVAFGLRRRGSYTNSGVSQVTDISGDQPVWAFTMPFLFSTRAEAWGMIKFFDSRAGRLFPFWVVSPTSDYQVVAFTIDGVQVTAVGAEIDWQYRPFIALVKADGSVQIREVSSHSRASGVDSLVLDSPFTSPDTSGKLTTVRLMRWDSDELVEQWRTDGVCQISADFVGVQREYDVTIEGIIDPNVTSLSGFFTAEGGGESSGVVAPMFYWPCPAPSERPLGRAADLLLPVQILVRIKGENFQADPAREYAVTLDPVGVLAAIDDTFALQYVGAIGGTSRHWAHTQCTDAVTFGHSNPNCSRHRWRATKTYIGGLGLSTLTVDFIAEWADTTTGAAGALFNVYVYTNELTPSFMDGDTADDGFDYTKDDPALLDAVTKRGHPQLLLMASVPTTWTAACDNTGVGCDSPVAPYPSNGFSACFDTANAAPWHGNDPTLAIGSSAFLLKRDMFFGVAYPARALSLGGDCPRSEVFGHLIIENTEGTGLTALMPNFQTGWDEAAGTLDVAGGSSVEISLCYPPQPLIKCCESNLDAPFAGSGGNPECWRSPPSSPDSCDPAIEVAEDDGPRRVCCFPTDSTVTVAIVQRCKSTLDCPDLPLVTTIGTATKNYTLVPCHVDYWTDGDSVDMQEEREFKWAAKYRQPEYVFADRSDNFSSGNTLGFTDDQGTWAYGTGEAVASGDGGGHLPKSAILYTDSYINGTASVDCLSPVEQGLIVRTAGGSPNDGYAIMADPTAGTLTIYLMTGSGKTTIEQTTGLTFSEPYRLKVVFEGPLLTATIDDDSLLSCQATDCTYYAAGYVGMISSESVVDASFDNIEILDNAPAGYSEIQVFYRESGWRLTCPTEIMPIKFTPVCPTDIPDGCSRTNTICPTSIDRYWGDYCVAMPDRAIKAGKASCKCDPYDLVGFRCATVRVSSSCPTELCPDGSVNQCEGIDVYIGVYNP